MIECVERSHFPFFVWVCMSVPFSMCGYACFFALYVIVIVVVMCGLCVKSTSASENQRERRTERKKFFKKIRGQRYFWVVRSLNQTGQDNLHSSSVWTDEVRGIWVRL